MQQVLPILMTVGITAVLLGIIVVIYLLIKKNSDEQKYEEEINELIADDFSDEEETVSRRTGMISKWNRNWGSIFRSAGLAKYSDEENQAGRDVAIGTVILFIILTLIFRNPLISIGISVGLLFVLSTFLKTKYNRKSVEINNLLPGFIFALKANIQASETNERALLKVIDGMPSPLYDDLIIAKNMLLASETFHDSILAMQDNTSSDDLKFLCACLLQSADSGANMEQQLDSIQRVLESRKQVENEIAKAVKTVQPAIILSSIAIPGLFVASYFLDSSAQEFWFVNPLSWIALAVVVALYVISLVLVKKQVDKIKNI